MKILITGGAGFIGSYLVGTEVKRSALNWNKIKKDLNWQPKVKLEEGIRKTIDWFKKFDKIN